MIEWSASKLSALRQCHRKFYFAYELADHNFTHPIRRKAFELGQSKNLKMWQGTLIDNAFSQRIIIEYKQRRTPDYEKIATETVEIAKRQFEFSEKRSYHLKGMTKTKAGDAFQILDVHESEVPFTEEAVLKVYSTVKEIIVQIPSYPSPVEGKTLHEFLMESSRLIPNQRFWSFEYEGIRLNPQIDLVRFSGKTFQVIDWKVSDSQGSDYSRQLILAGLVAFQNVKKNNQDSHKPLPRLEDVKLYEVNLMNGNTKEHYFTKENIAATLDYVYKFSGDQQQLNSDKKWNELNIEDFDMTDKKETCIFCKFRPLCTHLLTNNLLYDEQKYHKLVSNPELAGAQLPLSFS